MMAGLFLVMAIGVAWIYFGKWFPSTAIVIAALVLGVCMLYYHMTSTLQINW